MSRTAKLSLALLIPFMLACNFLTAPINQAQEAASTIEAIATSMPVETLVAIPTELGDLMPTLEAGFTDMPDLGGLGDMFNPQGEPVDAWKEIPIMSQATAGQEFPDASVYSFKAPVTTDEVTKFYEDNLTASGWQSMFAMPGTTEGSILLYTNDSGATLTITILPAADDQGVVAVLQLAQ